MNENKLKERINEISEQLSELANERRRLEQQLVEYNKNRAFARFKAWGIKEGSCVALFAKQPDGFHWHIAKAFKVIEVDEEDECIETITSTYGEADYEYYVRTEKIRVSLSFLEELEKEFNIYIIDEVQLVLLQQWFNSLAIEYNNYKKYEDAIAKNASMAIKLSQR